LARLATALLGAAFWLLSLHWGGESAGRHGGSRAPGPFEKAGIVELKEGQQAPALTLATLDGGNGSLGDHLDRLVILNFWATWCQPCTIEMPSLEALWRRYRDRGLVVVAVSVDRGSPRGLLEPYVRRLKLTFPILLDPDAATSEGWRVTALPATFIIRPGGDVTGIAVGARAWDSAEMRSLVERLLPRERCRDRRRWTTRSDRRRIPGWAETTAGRRDDHGDERSSRVPQGLGREPRDRRARRR